MVLSQKAGPIVWTKGYLVRASIVERMKKYIDEADIETL